MRIFRVFVLAVTLLLLPHVSLAADQDPCAVEPSVSDVQFTLSLQNGQKIFHEGEVIRMRLAFSSSSNRYFVHSTREERSSRFGYDVFCPQPKGDEVFRTYFKGGGSLVTPGNLGEGDISEFKLTRAPSAVDEELNEWVRLPAGHYSLYAVSGRISRLQEKGESSLGHMVVPVRSNPIEFDVQPADEAWQNRQLHDAMAILANYSQPEHAKRAARILRYLGTRESIQPLIEFADATKAEPGRSDLLLGLLSSPFPEQAVKAMRSEFAAPTYPIDGGFLRTLDLIQLEPDPPQPWLQLEAHYRQVMHAEVSALASVVFSKIQPARAISLSTMLSAVDVDHSLIGTVRPALIASWKDLPVETQEQVIVHRWELFNTPEMLSVLRSIVSETPPRSQSPQLRNAALKHIYEINPAEGRALIANDLYNPISFPDPDNVRLLTRDQIQAAVPAAIKRIANGTPNALDYEILDHFGDASAIGAVQAAYDSLASVQDCQPRGHLIRFLLRVSSEIGVEQVREALADRSTRCYTFVFQNLDDELPVAEELAIEALNDPDSLVVSSAVRALGRWGDARAEAPLWSRLELFEKEWKPRASEVVFNIGGDTPGQRAFHLEQELEVALSTARGWICPLEKLTRLSDLALSDFNRDQIKLEISKWQHPPYEIDPAWIPEQGPVFGLFSYPDLDKKLLYAKLAQFPRGTVFAYIVWTPSHMHPPVDAQIQEDEFQRTRAFAESIGLVVTRKQN